MKDLNVFAMSKVKCFVWMSVWGSIGVVCILADMGSFAAALLLFAGYYGVAGGIKVAADQNRAAQSRVTQQQLQEQPTPQPTQPDANRVFLPTRPPTR